MPGLQRTFELIPTTLVRPNENRPTRMTSKAVKKAYQQANRAQGVSRAEQRRRDADELERQKKAYEKERAAARAKAARDKKTAKENAEKGARRKMGLPEPSRFVRASQPRISKFVRNDSTGKRSWQEMKTDAVAEDSDGTLSDVGEKGAKPHPKRVEIQGDSEDEFGEFPYLSQSDILENIDSSVLSMPEGVSGPGNPTVSAKQPYEPSCREPSQELPQRKSSEDEYPPEDSQAFAEMANTQLLSEAAEEADKSNGAKDLMLPIPKEAIHRPANMTPRKLNKAAVKSMVNNQPFVKLEKSPTTARPALQVSVNMSPPQIKFNEKSTIKFAPTPQKAKLLPRSNANMDNRIPPNIPPSATQAFLESHLDDFFPSPTQEMRELLSDADSLPSNTQIARELSPEGPEETVNSLLSNRQAIRGNLTKLAEDDHVDDLICTQDLILSSQELLGIMTPIHAPERPIIEPELANHKTVSNAKPRFFEEKEDDLQHAVLRENRTTSVRPRAAAPQVGEKRSPFFEEKEEDLWQAAIHESKLMAAKDMLKVPLKEGNGNQRKERDLKRTLSTATTDYGEDDFSGVEWDSLGL